MNTDEKTVKTKEVETLNRVVSSEIQSIIDVSELKGAVLIYDAQEHKYYSNDFSWAERGNLPASTFKITNSIIALETGVVENDSTVFKWDGQKRRLKNWEQDLTLKEAFHFSCVPCYQEVARNVGLDQMIKELTKLNYGAMDVDSSNLDLFWLEGESRISQMEQIDFLQRFYDSKLSISERTEKIMKQLMVREETDTYTLSGKTGWAIRGEIDNGWFVGYVEKEENVYYFATNVEPKENFDIMKFSAIRRDITYQALRELGILENVMSTSAK